VRIARRSASFRYRWLKPENLAQRVNGVLKNLAKCL